MPVLRHWTLPFVSNRRSSSSRIVLRLTTLRTCSWWDIGVLWPSSRAFLQTSKVLVLWLGNHLCQDVCIISPLCEPYQPTKRCISIDQFLNQSNTPTSVFTFKQQKNQFTKYITSNLSFVNLPTFWRLGDSKGTYLKLATIDLEVQFWQGGKGGAWPVICENDACALPVSDSLLMQTVVYVIAGDRVKTATG